MMRVTMRVTTRLTMRVTVVAVMLALASAPAEAFHPDVHRVLTVRSLRGSIKHGSVLPPDIDKLIDFYSWLGWSMAKRGGDEAGKARFLSIFPDRKDFDAIGVRRLLALSPSPEITVHGVTAVTRSPEPDRFSALANNAAQPALDHRARDRVLHDRSHERVNGADGRAVPLDPRTLQLGPPDGEGSEVWAHTALAPGLTRTDAPPASGLRVVPWLPGVEVRGGAAEVAQAHMDLSVLALNWGDTQFKQEAEYLALVWLGAALHYVQDAASPLNTVQLGAPGLLDWMAQQDRAAALRTAGGLLGPWRSAVPQALRIRRGLSEAGDRWLAGEVAKLLDEETVDRRIALALARDPLGDRAFDAGVRPGLAPWLKPPKEDEPSAKGRGAVSVLVDALAAAGAADGAALYDHLLAMHRPLGDDGTLTLRPRDDPERRAAELAIAGIQARALARGVAATRIAFDAWLNANPQAALDRLRRVRTLALEREQREAEAWRQAALVPPLRREPMWAAAEAGALALLLMALVWWWRRR